MATVEDHADLLVRLADRRPAQAFDLALGEHAVRRHPALGAHHHHIARDEAAGHRGHQVGMLFEQFGQVGERLVHRREADRGDLAEGQVHRHDDRGMDQRALAEIGQVHFLEIFVAPAAVHAGLVAPEGLALVAAGARQRRVEREPRILPPAFAIGHPAEDLAVDDRAIGIDHRLLGRDVVARRDAEAARLCHLVQRDGSVANILDPADRDPLRQRVERAVARLQILAELGRADCGRTERGICLDHGVPLDSIRLSCGRD